MELGKKIDDFIRHCLTHYAFKNLTESCLKTGGVKRLEQWRIDLKALGCPYSAQECNIAKASDIGLDESYRHVSQAEIQMQTDIFTSRRSEKRASKASNKRKMTLTFQRNKEKSHYHKE